MSLGRARTRWHRTHAEEQVAGRGLGVIPRRLRSAGKAAAAAQTQREGGADLRFLQTHGGSGSDAANS